MELRIGNFRTQKYLFQSTYQWPAEGWLLGTVDMEGFVEGTVDILGFREGWSLGTVDMEGFVEIEGGNDPKILGV